MKPRVWAPHAQRVELEIALGREPLRRGANGYFESARDCPAGTRYAFLVDGEGPFPDPRSQFQPLGVHGPSEVVEVANFAWTDAGFRATPLARAVLYELHVGTFTPLGTFESAIERLDDLRTLGVTHVEVMPVAEFSGEVGWGYDGVDLFAPHHAYGGPVGLARFVDACHARGLAVVLDVVYNHLGPVGNYLPRFGPYFSQGSTPWGQAPNFMGPHSDEVRAFFIDNALMWLRDYHFDGLRLDAADAIVDTSAVHFLEHLQRAVTTLEGEVGRPLALIAESWINDPRFVSPPERGGFGLAAHWNDDFHYALHAALTDERHGYYQDVGSLSALAKAVCRGYVMDGGYSHYRRRSYGRPAVGIGGERLVIYAQNHDQVGNRAGGERLSHITGIERAKLAMAIVMFSPSVPMLFQGEEWGCSRRFYYFTRHADPELGAAIHRARTSELTTFGWDPNLIRDPQEALTFSDSCLAWDERDREPHAGLLRWTQRLIALRNQRPELGVAPLDGRAVRVELDEAAKTFAIVRGELTLWVNAGSDAWLPACAAETELLLASRDEVGITGGGLSLPPDTAAITRRA